MKENTNGNVFKRCIPFDKKGRGRVFKFLIEPNTNGKYWNTKYLESPEHPPKPVKEFKIEFNMAPLAEEYGFQFLQQAICIVDLEEESIRKGWRFYGRGIVIPDILKNNHYRVTTRLTNENKKLIFVIDCVENTTPTKPESSKYIPIKFLYLASSGKGFPNQIFVSPDPSVSVGRGKGN